MQGATERRRGISRRHLVLYLHQPRRPTLSGHSCRSLRGSAQPGGLESGPFAEEQRYPDECSSQRDPKSVRCCARGTKESLPSQRASTQRRLSGLEHADSESRENISNGATSFPYTKRWCG